MSNLSRKLTMSLDFRAKKQAFWRWWSGAPRRKVKGASVQRFGSRQEGYRWVKHR